MMPGPPATRRVRRKHCDCWVGCGRIAETPKSRWELTGSLSIEKWMRKYRPRRGEGMEDAAVVMDWEASEHETGHR